MKCVIEAPAKINLSLDVVGKRQDGYHLLESIMQSIDLCDQIILETNDSFDESNKININTNKKNIPNDIRNTAYKAADLFFLHANIKRTNLNISIKKNIPQQAGLAGGSADAAGVLFGLNCIYPGRITKKKLLEIGVNVGADVPFCLTGGTALCEGIGEVITRLKSFPEKDILLIKPDFGVSTPWIFKNLEIDKMIGRPDTKRIISAIENQDAKSVYDLTYNVLEEVTSKKHSIITDIKTDLNACGSIFAMMTGSGTTVYGIFENEAQIDAAIKKLKAMNKYANYEFIKSKIKTLEPRLVNIH